MINKHALPNERINISITGRGAQEISKIFGVLDGLKEVLELTEQESITWDLVSCVLILHFTDLGNEVVLWRQRVIGEERHGLAQALIEPYDTKTHKRPSSPVMPEPWAQRVSRERALSEEIIRLRARRDNKMPQAWQYKAQPLVKRLIAASGIEAAQFLKACQLHSGNIHNLPVKPAGVTRKIKADTFVPVQGEIKPYYLAISYIPLCRGTSLNWTGGMNAGYRLIFAEGLPEILKESILGSLAADLVDDPRAKAMFGDMTVTGFDGANNNMLILSREDDELMEDEPDWLAHNIDRLNNRVANWANSAGALT